MMNSSSLTTFGRKSRKLVKTEHFVKVLVGQDASLPGDEQVLLVPLFPSTCACTPLLVLMHVPLPPPHGQVHHLALLGAHHHPWHPRTAGRHQHLAAGDSWCERKARSSTCASQHRGEERRFSKVG